MRPPADELDQIMAVMDAGFDPAFGEAWTRRQVEDALLLGACHYALIGADGGEPGPSQPAAGFYLAREAPDECELLLLAVIPSARRRGLGAALLGRFAATARERGAHRLLLEMRRGNPAEGLYRRHGFIEIGVRPRYYRSRDGSRIDAITFASEA